MDWGPVPREVGGRGGAKRSSRSPSSGGGMQWWIEIWRMVRGRCIECGEPALLWRWYALQHAEIKIYHLRCRRHSRR